MPSIFDFSHWPLWLAVVAVVHLCLVVSARKTKRTSSRGWWFWLVLSTIVGFATTFGLGLSVTDAIQLSQNPVAAGTAAFSLGCISLGAAILIPLVTIAIARR